MKLNRTKPLGAPWIESINSQHWFANFNNNDNNEKNKKKIQTKALSHCPHLNAENAESRANIELLHAVSTVKDGPFNPKQYEILHNTQISN